MLNTTRWCFTLTEPCPKYESQVLTCACMLSDVERHIHDLVPFEFARRGIHTSIEEQACENLAKNDINLSQLVEGSEGDEVAGGPGGFMLKSHSSRIVPRDVVTGVYPLGPNPAEVLLFNHGGHGYKLFWFKAGDEDRRTVDLVQLDAEQEQLESMVLVCDPLIDLLEEFGKRGMVYSSEEYGGSLLDCVTSDEREVHTPFIHGIRAYMSNREDEELRNAYLLLIAAESHPLLTYCVEDEDLDVPTTKWRLKLQESPEWALHT